MTPTLLPLKSVPSVQRLAALNLDVPLTVVLDNARYQRCAQVVTLAASLQIELCFLPPSSPQPQPD